MIFPHSAGQLSNNIWSRFSRAESQDLSSGVIVGQDNYTGRVLASDGSAVTRGQSDQDPELGKEVSIFRPNSAEKARNTVFKFATFRTIRTPGQTRFTNSSSSQKNVKSCGSKSTGSGYVFPAPPEEPPEDPPIDEPTTEAIASDDPLNPSVCRDPAPTVVRPRKMTDQYFEADSIDAPCPLGYIKAGYADLGGGDILIQCKSPKPIMIGDALPVDPTTYGYDISPCGNCIKTKGGKFATLAECQNQGEFPVTYTCTPSGCIAVYDGTGNFTTLAQCENSCSAVPYACIDGNCVQTLDGKYATLAECEGVCSPAPTNTQILVFISTSNRGNSWSCLNLVGRTNLYVLEDGIKTDTQLVDTGLLVISAGGRLIPPDYECKAPETYTPSGGITGYYIQYGSDQGSFIIVYQRWGTPASGTGSYSSLTFTPY